MDKIVNYEIIICYRCSGHGRTMDEFIAYLGDGEEKECPVCKGSGLLKKSTVYEPFDPKSNG